MLFLRRKTENEEPQSIFSSPVAATADSALPPGNPHRALGKGNTRIGCRGAENRSNYTAVGAAGDSIGRYRGAAHIECLARLLDARREAASRNF